MAPSQENQAGSLTAWGRILLAFLLFNAIAAVAGGIAVMNDAMPFPDIWLQDTHFHSYFLPGLVLFLAVGGSQLVAAYTLLRRHTLTKRAALLAGIVLTGWMIGELTIIGLKAPIQVFFLSMGLIEFGLSFAPLRHS
jgi:hypothetical protein